MQDNGKELVWRKARASAVTNCEQCVEVAHDDDVYIRDSKRPEGGHLTVTKEAFGRFLAGLKG